MRAQAQNRRTPRSSPSPRALARTPSPMYPSRERTELSYIHDAGSSPHFAQNLVVSGDADPLETPTMRFMGEKLKPPDRDGPRSRSRSPTPNLFPSRDPYLRSQKASVATTRTAPEQDRHSPPTYPPPVRRANPHQSVAESGRSSPDDSEVEDANPQNFSTNVVNTIVPPSSSNKHQDAVGKQRKNTWAGLTSSERHTPSRLPVVFQSSHLSGVKHSALGTSRHAGLSQPATTSSKDATMAHVSMHKKGWTELASLPTVSRPDDSSRSRSGSGHPRTTKPRKSGLNASGALAEVQMRNSRPSIPVTQSERHQSEQEHTSTSNTPSPPPITAPPPSPLETLRIRSQRSFSHLKHAAQSPSAPRPRSKSTSEDRSLSRASEYTVDQKGRARHDVDSTNVPPPTGKADHLNSPQWHASMLAQTEKSTSRSRTQPKDNDCLPNSAPIPFSKYDEKDTAGGPEHDNHLSKGSRAREMVDKERPNNPRSTRPTWRAEISTANNNPHGAHQANSPRVRFSPSTTLEKDFQKEHASAARPPNHRGTLTDLNKVVKRLSSRTLLENQDLVKPDGELMDNNTFEPSTLRRITTSPFPSQNDESAYPEAHESPGGNFDAQSTFVGAPESLYMASNDTQERPYANCYLVPQQAATQPSYYNPTHSYNTLSAPIHEHGDRACEDVRASSPTISRPHSYGVEYPRQDCKMPATYDPLGPVSSVNSGLSILSDDRRFSDCDTSISGAAEELFKNISNSSSIPDNHSSTDISEPASPHEDSIHKPSYEALSNLADSQSDPAAAITPLTWRETLTEDAYQALIAHYDIFEMRRQEVIWELCRSEEECVDLLQLILKLFIRPLRSGGETRWIPGLDTDVAKLFDWLDDIAQLHTEVLSIMRGCRANQLPIVTQIGESLRPFVARLELYQPYVARVDGISDAIRRMMHDSESDFGEFVRIQSASSERPVTLLELLQVPVERLLKYPVYFKQIFELTPRSHTDHLGVFSLLHCTEMMIRVLQSVKSREQEYSAIKALATRIQGIPPEFRLARRERRLIAQGPLLRLFLDSPLHGEALTLMSGTDYVPSPGLRGRTTPSTKPQNNPSYRLNTARSRPSIYHSSTESHPATEASTILDSVYTAAQLSSDSLSGDLPLRPDSEVSVSGMFLHGDDPSTTKSSKWIYAFVFTDIVVLAKHRRQVNIRGVTTESWDLLPDIGLARVLGYSDMSGSQYDHLIAVELLPLDYPGSLPSKPLAIPVYLSLAERGTGRMSLAPPDVLQAARKQWSDAFSRCYVYTMRSLAFPANLDSHMRKSGNSRQPLSDTPDSILSVLSSDRSLPKSPSAQLLDPDLEPIEQERQERDWWSARFQQELEELSAGTELYDIPTVSAVNPPQHNKAPWDAIDREVQTNKTRTSRPISILKGGKAKLFKTKG